MTNQHNLPGMDKGMFFEYYVFEPRTNFVEEDLYHLVRHFDCTFAKDNPPPHQHHFDGLTFSPKEGITVSEFTDILTAMNIRVVPELLARLPKQLQAHFDDNGLFCPYDDFSLEDLNLFFMKLLKFRISTEQFNTLPQNMKRQFIVYTRDGKAWRYGSRRPG